MNRIQEKLSARRNALNWRFLVQLPNGTRMKGVKFYGFHFMLAIGNINDVVNAIPLHKKRNATAA